MATKLQEKPKAAKTKKKKLSYVPVIRASKTEAARAYLEGSPIRVFDTFVNPTTHETFTNERTVFRPGSFPTLHAAMVNEFGMQRADKVRFIYEIGRYA